MANYSDYNGTITAYGMSPQSVAVRVTSISYGLNIIGSEDEAARAKTFYARQVQEDVFHLTVQFITLAERRSFFKWFQSYAILATQPSPVGAMRVQVPVRGFDFYGTLTQGVQEVTTPQDVTWSMALQFNGAQPTVAISSAYLNDASAYTPPSNDPTSATWFYPSSSLSAQNNADYIFQAQQAISQTIKDIQAILHSKAGS
jgi:hypothetical protein